mmetsp:Transcript_36875/g.114779  ORF Transcript_36875/g.114779 Transcript_36875/m.114779 type:complete len:215 (-) Transcript_36875:144-788(-)
MFGLRASGSIMFSSPGHGTAAAADVCGARCLGPRGAVQADDRLGDRRLCNRSLSEAQRWRCASIWCYPTPLRPRRCCARGQTQHGAPCREACGCGQRSQASGGSCPLLARTDLQGRARAAAPSWGRQEAQHRPDNRSFEQPPFVQTARRRPSGGAELLCRTGGRRRLPRRHSCKEPPPCVRALAHHPYRAQAPPAVGLPGGACGLARSKMSPAP